MARWTEEQTAVTQARIIELRRDHIEFEDIGRLMWAAGEWPGSLSAPPSKQAVWQHWRRGLSAIPAPGLAALRAERGEYLGELLRKAQEIIDREHVAHSNGVVVHDPATGKPLLDDGPRIAAIRESRMIHAQLSVLNGENAPVQSKVTMDATIQYEVVSVDPEALK